VQILGDSHGGLIHLGERECSIQRRHQKLIEESPSSTVDRHLRERMGEAALRLARAAGYTNAGTVEFLLEPDGRFAFLEVNARLQVEHPVTEAVTGLDLVELQLRVAAGERLELTQEDVRFEGHAIEARVIAEDALAGFLPSSGRVEVFQAPAGVRADTWLRDGTTVSPYYDSLLAKVIAHDVTRHAAASRLAEALREMRIKGVRDNVDLLLATVESEPFLRGELHTGFLEEQRLLEELAEVPPPVIAAAAALDRLEPGKVDDPWRSRTGWRQARLAERAVWVRAGREHAARVSGVAGQTERVVVDVDGRSVHVRRTGTASRLEVEGESVTIRDFADVRIVQWHDRTYRLERGQPPRIEDVAVSGRAGGEAGQVTAPMPGRIVKLVVRDGERVALNQPLVVLEAMKMEHVVEAPHAGIVAEVHVNEGEQVASGALLLSLAPLE
jgi:acetyl/propionyl-CoA carboxylase alpha subunit